MKKVAQPTLGLTIQKPYIESAEELAEVLGVSVEEAQERLIELANQQYTVHNWLVKLRTKALEVLGGELGLEREHEVKDGNKKYTESESKFKSRIEEYADENDIDLSDYTELVQAAADNIPYDFKQTVRGAGGSSKPAQKWLDVVAGIIAQDKLDAAADKYNVEVELDEEGKLTEECEWELANKIRVAVTEAQKAAAKSALAGI